MTSNKIFFLCIALLLPFPGRSEVRNLTLQECIGFSHTGNAAILNAELDRRAAEAQKQETLALWFPTVSASAYAFHAVNPLIKVGIDDLSIKGDAAWNLKYYLETGMQLLGVNPEINLLRNGYIASVNVSQPLFAGGRIANGNALASLGVKAAGLKKDLAARDNDDIVAAKYWTVVSLDGKEKALRQGLELISSLEKDVKEAYSAGLAKESDLMQVKLKAKELETMMIQLRSGQRLAKMDLLNYIGKEFKVLELDSLTFSDTLDIQAPPEQLYRNEDSIAAGLDETKLLDISVEAKRLEKKMAVGEGLPQIGIGASMGYGKIVGDRDINGAVFAMVKIPLTDWWKTSGKIKRCQYEIEKAENERDYLKKQLVLKVSKEWTDLQCAWEKKSVAEEAVSLCESIERQKRAEYGSGLCTLTELLQCQAELQSKRSELVDCRTAYRTAMSVWVK